MQEDVFGLVGTTIDGRYRVDASIGEGGFGVVYRGWHLNFDHAVAIKCLKVPPHFTADAQRLFLESFRNEGKLLSALASRNLAVVRVYDFGVTTSLRGVHAPYLILEWLVGQDLDAILAHRLEAGLSPYSEQEAVSLLRPAVEALASAHVSNPPIAHRDIKPANLFVVELDGKKSLKVLDFGIAKAMQEGDTATQLVTRTASPFAAFSPAYGAPEQFLSGAEGYGRTGPWTDVHALGLILVELVTGKPALDGTNQYTLFSAATAATRPTPRARRSDCEVSEGLETVCAKALALRSADRYQNAGELLDALDALTRPVPRPGAELPVQRPGADRLTVHGAKIPRRSARPSRSFVPWFALGALALGSATALTLSAASRAPSRLEAEPKPAPLPISSASSAATLAQRPSTEAGIDNAAPASGNIVSAAMTTDSLHGETAAIVQPASTKERALVRTTTRADLHPERQRLASGDAAARVSREPDDADAGIPSQAVQVDSHDATIAAPSQPVRGGSRYDATSTPGVVLDTVTGLRWQRALPSTYEGCAGRYDNRTGHVGDACAWPEAKRYCAALMLAGQRGWRLPTKRELESIVDRSKASPAIDLTVFPKTPASLFWSDSLYGPAASSQTTNAAYGHAWYVGFYRGYADTHTLSFASLVRCVR